MDTENHYYCTVENLCSLLDSWEPLLHDAAEVLNYVKNHLCIGPRNSDNEQLEYDARYRIELHY